MNFIYTLPHAFISKYLSIVEEIPLKVEHIFGQIFMFVEFSDDFRDLVIQRHKFVKIKFCHFSWFGQKASNVIQESLKVGFRWSFFRFRQRSNQIDSQYLSTTSQISQYKSENKSGLLDDPLLVWRCGAPKAPHQEMNGRRSRVMSCYTSLLEQNESKRKF